MMKDGRNSGRELSYPCDFIAWDGRRLSLVDPAQVAGRLRLLREIGANWIMTGGIQFIEPADFAMDDGVRRFAGQLADAGLKVSSIHLVQRNLVPVGEDQKVVRAVMERTVRACAPLRPRALVLHAGMKLTMGRVSDDWTFWACEVKRVGREAMLATVADNLRHMARRAADYGINLALENVGRFEPLGDLDTLPELVTRVDAPNLGYCVDSGHAHAFGQPVAQWLMLAGAKLFETHFHDNHGSPSAYLESHDFVLSTPAVDEHLPPGFGTIDWRVAIRTLDAIGYTGPVAFESGGWPGEDPETGLRHAVAWWRVAEYQAQLEKESLR